MVPEQEDRALCGERASWGAWQWMRTCSTRMRTRLSHLCRGRSVPVSEHASSSWGPTRPGALMVTAGWNQAGLVAGKSDGKWGWAFSQQGARLLRPSLGGYG